MSLCSFKLILLGPQLNLLIEPSLDLIEAALVSLLLQSFLLIHPADQLLMRNSWLHFYGLFCFWLLVGQKLLVKAKLEVSLQNELLDFLLC